MMCLYVCYVFFFFKQKTAYEMRISDWSSDVCSSDLTLANTEKILLALTQRVDVIAKSPAMKLTPETMGERVNASVASATGELHNLVNSTRSDMSEAARELRGLIGTTRARWQQDRWLFWIGLG